MLSVSVVQSKVYDRCTYVLLPPKTIKMTFVHREVNSDLPTKDGSVQFYLSGTAVK